MCRNVLLTVASLVLAAEPGRAADKFADLLKDIPPPVNAIAVCDVQALYSSPLGQRSDWARSGAIGFPAAARQFVQGTRLDPETLRPTGPEYGIAYLKDRVTMDALNRREMGARDTVAGAEAVLSPRNAYFVDLRPWTVGLMAPADRQGLATFVRFTRNSPRVNLPPFLTESVVNQDPKTQFVLAMDLTDAVNPARVRARLGEIAPLAAVGVNLDALATLLGGLRGVRLEAQVTDAIRGELRVAFEQEVGALGAAALPLFQAALERRGAAIEEMTEWKATTSGKTIVFSGPLSERSLRRIASLLQLPTPSLASGEGESTALAAELTARASQYYFKAVTADLEELKKPTRQAKKSQEAFAHWHETHAEQIDQIAPYNVDPELRQYGAATAERLRAISASLRGDVVDVNQLEKRISYGFNAGAWYGSPYLFVQTNQAQIRDQQREVMLQGEQARTQIWQKIDADTAAVRKRMTDKYKAPF